MRQRLRWCAEPDERRGQRHEQQMLNHVDCQQLVVEGSYR